MVYKIQWYKQNTKKSFDILINDELYWDTNFTYNYGIGYDSDDKVFFFSPLFFVPLRYINKENKSAHMISCDYFDSNWLVSLLDKTVISYLYKCA